MRKFIALAIFGAFFATAATAQINDRPSTLDFGSNNDDGIEDSQRTVNVIDYCIVNFETDYGSLGDLEVSPASTGDLDGASISGVGYIAFATNVGCDIMLDIAHTSPVGNDEYDQVSFDLGLALEQIEQENLTGSSSTGSSTDASFSFGNADERVLVSGLNEVIVTYQVGMEATFSAIASAGEHVFDMTFTAVN
jgi:hypothetical protein